MVTLQEVKQYLRVDFEDDDTLLLSLISTAKQLVMDVGRMDEERFSENEDVVRTASSTQFLISMKTAILQTFPS